MSCPACGQPIEPGQASCKCCGAALPEPAPGCGTPHEGWLYRVGPMGFGVCFSRPGLFVFTYQNCTEIVATTERLCGVRKMPRFVFARHGRHAGESVFSIPWRDVIEFRRADYLLNAALWIRYRDGDAVKEVGIEGAVFWRHCIRELEAIARRCCPTGVTAPVSGRRSSARGGGST